MRPAARGFRVAKFKAGLEESSGEEEVDVGRETGFDSREISVVARFDESVVVDGEVVDGEVVDGEVVDGEFVDGALVVC